ncbi:MAG: hypothetical protein HW402_1284 [Dehalococcoidales bacterium]|nr:hypothetical protein [Dehalococcoidales bacterium]
MPIMQQVLKYVKIAHEASKNIKSEKSKAHYYPPDTHVCNTMVKLSALAWKIAGELEKTQPRRQVEFIIALGQRGNIDDHVKEAVCW